MDLMVKQVQQTNVITKTNITSMPFHHHQFRLHTYLQHMCFSDRWGGETQTTDSGHRKKRREKIDQPFETGLSSLVCVCGSAGSHLNCGPHSAKLSVVLSLPLEFIHQSLQNQSLQHQSLCQNLHTCVKPLNATERHNDHDAKLANPHKEVPNPNCGWGPKKKEKKIRGRKLILKNIYKRSFTHHERIIYYCESL